MSGDQRPGARRSAPPADRCGGQLRPGPQAPRAAAPLAPVEASAEPAMVEEPRPARSASLVAAPSRSTRHATSRAAKPECAPDVKRPGRPPDGARRRWRTDPTAGSAGAAPRLAVMAGLHSAAGGHEYTACVRVTSETLRLADIVA